MSSRRMSIAVSVAIGLALALPLVASTREVPLTTSSPEARELYVKAQEKADNLENQAALQLIEQALAKDPDFAMAYLLRAGSVGAFPAFRESLEKAVSLADKVSPGERELILASKAQADGDMAATKSHLDTVAAQFPNDKRVIIRLARYQRAMGNERQAAVLFRKATTIDPAFAPAYNDLGYAQVALKNFAGAEASFKRYIRLLPDSPNPYDSYAEMLMKVGRYNASIAQYRKALEKNADFVSSLAGIGMNQVLKKDYQAARATFEQQRAKESDLDGQLNALENVAKSYVHEGDRERAVSLYDDITNRATEGDLSLRAANAQLDAALVLTEGGDAAAALPHVERAESIISGASLPESVAVRRQSAVALARANALSAQGQFDAARSALDAARSGIEQRQIPAEMNRLYLAMGTLANRQKRYDQALALLKKGDAQDPYTLYQRAVAEAGLGQASQAATHFATVARWNGNDLGYALVRTDAAEKGSAAPVATAGRSVPVKKR